MSSGTEGDSFISYLPVPSNHKLIREVGIAEFSRREAERVAFLDRLIHTHDDGRGKGFYCLAVQLLPLDELRQVVDHLADTLTGAADLKDRAAFLRSAFGQLASDKGLTLKLRHPKKEAGHNL